MLYGQTVPRAPFHPMLNKELFQVIKVNGTPYTLTALHRFKYWFYFISY
jgi:hypothetical protein